MHGGVVLEVEIREKSYPVVGHGPRVLLRDVAFTASSGEVLALLGPSGIGKTTVLRIILRFDSDFQGRVILPPGRLGVMFQEPRLLPWLTVAGNLRLVRTTSVADSGIPALLEAALLPPVANLLPSELSLGMQRRVAFARALAVDPDTLILDEPFASLDPGLGTALAATLAARARRRGTLVLLSTHDLDYALSIAGRVLVLSGEPATLAGDFPVPPHDDAGAVNDLRRDLLARFSFLGNTMDEAGA